MISLTELNKLPIEKVDTLDDLDLMKAQGITIDGQYKYRHQKYYGKFFKLMPSTKNIIIRYFADSRIMRLSDDEFAIVNKDKPFLREIKSNGHSADLKDNIYSIYEKETGKKPLNKNGKETTNFTQWLIIRNDPNKIKETLIIDKTLKIDQTSFLSLEQGDLHTLTLFLKANSNFISEDWIYRCIEFFDEVLKKKE